MEMNLYYTPSMLFIFRLSFILAAPSEKVKPLPKNNPFRRKFLLLLTRCRREVKPEADMREITQSFHSPARRFQAFLQRAEILP
jgi:hypothetical protein